MKIPKLLTSREYAAKIGMSLLWVQRACKEGRIPDAQLVGTSWIIPEGAHVMLPNTTLAIPPQYLARAAKAQPKYTMPKGNPSPLPLHGKLLKTPGLSRVLDEMGVSRREVHRRTGIHMNTLQRAMEGRAIKANTLLRIARALDIEYDELLRR